MLIWKVIEANPGITQDEIWNRVQDDIPPGYALRCYAASRTRSNKSWIEMEPRSNFRELGDTC